MEAAADSNFDEELHKLLVRDASDLPPFPLSAVDFTPDFTKPAHDHYIYRHPNGQLCEVGLSPGHAAPRDKGGVKGVDFNVGKSDWSAIKVPEKRKKSSGWMCCVKVSLLEVNEKLVKQPDLLNTAADREGYITIIMPKPADWLKVKATFLSREEYNNLRAKSL